MSTFRCLSRKNAPAIFIEAAPHKTRTSPVPLAKETSCTIEESAPLRQKPGSPSFLPGLHPLLPLQLGDIRKALSGMAEEPPKSFAEIIVGDPFGHLPVILAASVAEPSPPAGKAFRRLFLPPQKKALRLLRVCHLSQRRLMYRSHPPLIQHKKVAGIDAAVSLHHIVSAAVPAGGAGNTGLPQHHIDIVLKQADTPILPGLPVPIPQVKEAA